MFFSRPCNKRIEILQMKKFKLKKKKCRNLLIVDEMCDTKFMHASKNKESLL